MSQPLSPPPFRIDRERLDRAIAPIVAGNGAEVFDVEFKREMNGWILRVFVEKAGAAEKRLSTKDAAVDIDLCSRIARELSPALDVADVIPQSYNLEVSSPGIERPLRGEADFARFEGLRAKIKVQKPVAGQRVLVGTLGKIDNGHLAFADGGTQRRIPVADIESARLVFEFGAGPASRPGPSSKPGRKPHPKRPLT